MFNARGVCEWDAFVAVAGAAASVRVVVALNLVTVYVASTATSTATASTVSCNLCRYCQLNSHRLRATGGWNTVRRVPHVTLPDEGSEGGVQARWSMVGEESELVMEVLEGDGGEGARLG